MVSETLMQQVFAKLGCKPSDVKLLGGYNGNIFEINGGKDIVIKILESSNTLDESLLILPLLSTILLKLFKQARKE